MSNEEADRTNAPAADATEADHYETLFEIVSRRDINAEQSVALDAADREQMEEIHSVLHIVDRQRPVTTADLEDIEARFLRLLAEEEPSHPWVSSSQQDTEEVEVKTVGDIVRLAYDDRPLAVSQEILDFLFQSTTPLSEMADTAQRPGVLGPLFKQAGVPPAKIPEMFQWMNVGMNSLEPGQNGAFVARRQKRKPKTSI